jgi:hypothetical protein
MVRQTTENVLPPCWDSPQRNRNERLIIAVHDPALGLMAGDSSLIYGGHNEQRRAVITIMEWNRADRRHCETWRRITKTRAGGGPARGRWCLDDRWNKVATSKDGRFVSSHADCRNVDGCSSGHNALLCTELRSGWASSRVFLQIYAVLNLLHGFIDDIRSNKTRATRQLHTATKHAISSERLHVNCRQFPLEYPHKSLITMWKMMACLRDECRTVSKYECLSWAAVMIEND